jgi:hypothetical protein
MDYAGSDGSGAGAEVSYAAMMAANSGSPMGTPPPATLGQGQGGVPSQQQIRRTLSK